MWKAAARTAVAGRPCSISRACPMRLRKSRTTTRRVPRRLSPRAPPKQAPPHLPRPVRRVRRVSTERGDGVIKISSWLRRAGLIRRKPLLSDDRWRIDMDEMGGPVGRVGTEPMRLPGVRKPAAPPKPAPRRTPQKSNPQAVARPPVRPRTISPPVLDRVDGKEFLAVHGVEKSFGGRKVVKGVSLYVRSGEAVGLLGPNGAGKTTVFYMITGLIAADRGSVELDGYDVTRLPMYQRARLGVGYLPQEASIFRGLNVEENIRSVLEVVEPDRKRRDRDLEQLLDEFNIARLRKTPSIALSGGERRRVEIAR